MDELFLGRSDSFWIGLSTISALAATVILAVTGWLVYRQLRTTARTFQFDGIRKMQEMVDEFRQDRGQIYTSFPLELIVSSTQFADYPPGREVSPRVSKDELDRMHLTDQQVNALGSLTEQQIDLAKRVIGKLNDLGQLVEDGYIDRRVFLGKYHTMIIRLSHFLEPIRRQEENRQGGSFGQRLLRVRHDAIRYNTLCPKHRQTEIRIVSPRGSKTIIPGMKGTVWQRVFWGFQRRFF